jgi:predicted flap endonuclease-1-like 5' DNA nuclease
MFNKIKKIIQDDLHRRYEQLEERFLVFEQRVYGHLADRLEGLENQLEQLSELLRQKAGKANEQEAPETDNNDDDDDVEVVVEKPEAKSAAEEEKPKKTTKTKKKTIKPDPLLDLPGLGNSMEKKLNAEGVFTFEQLANLTETEIVALNEKIPGLKIRYERYEWKTEAEKLKKGE